MKFLLLVLSVFLAGCGTDWDVQYDGYGTVAETKSNGHTLRISEESLSYNLTPNPRLAKGERGGEYLIYISPSCEGISDVSDTVLIEVDGFSVNMKAACNEGNASYKVHSWSKEPAIININGVQQSISVSSLIENIKKRNSVVINDIKFETQGFNSAWASAL